MNILGDIHEIEDRLDEIGWHLRTLRSDIGKGAGAEHLLGTLADIGYQASQIEQMTLGMERSLR